MNSFAKVFKLISSVIYKINEIYFLWILLLLLSLFFLVLDVLHPIVLHNFLGSFIISNLFLFLAGSIQDEGRGRERGYKHNFEAPPVGGEPCDSPLICVSVDFCANYCH